MPDYHIPLIPDKTYHVFSRAIGNERLFRETTNYQFFLSRFHKHVSPVADNLSYCLLPNHFHSMLRIKNELFIKEHFYEVKKKKLFTPELASDFIMERISNLLNSYTKSYNKMYKRRGSLFIDYCRRVEINSDAQFGATIFYIHKNPVHHGYCNSIEKWPWSSYHEFASGKTSSVSRQEVLDWFGGVKGFMAYHQQPIYLKEYPDFE